MSRKAECREFTRCPVRVKAELRLPSGILLEGETRDVSMKGIWFMMERSLPVGNLVKLDLVLRFAEHEHRVATEGVVVRVDEGGVAVEFKEIEVESVERLRRLVRDHSDNAVRVDREFAAHETLHPHA